MNEYIIEDDRKKLICYTGLNLLLTLFLFILSASFFSTGLFIVSFLGITGMWFSIKAMCKYGNRLINKIPVCEFKKSEVIVHSLPEEESSMKYNDIKEVKILKDSKSLKLFFAGNMVTHPSGWNYVGIIYPFQRSLLADTENNIKNLFNNHKVEYSIIEKN